MYYDYAMSGMHTMETPYASAATSSTSPLKELKNNLSKAFGLGEVSKAPSSRSEDFITTSQSESSDQMVDIPTDFIDDTPPCVPGPSGTSRIITKISNPTTEEPTRLRRFPSFTELKSWSTKDPEIDYEGMALNYLPYNSP